VVFFFFSSRRRHTRSYGDWSSDMCSSDLDIPAEIVGRAKHFYSIYDKMAKKGKEFNEIYDLTAMRVIVERQGDEGTRDCYGALRSEERRVGKVRRAGWWGGVERIGRRRVG